MSTPHNRAEKGDFARTVLMPGDPRRAAFIAEHFLEQPRLVTDVRNVCGYTGTYKGRPVSVMASGMGMPSIGIYSYELFRFYDVDNIIRVGSAGAYTDDLHVFDVVLATAAYSESTYALTQNGKETAHVLYPSPMLNQRLQKAAADLHIPLHTGTIHSSDIFYHDSEDYLAGVRANQCLCVEMESFALFHNANVLHKNAACILTISDSLTTHEETTPEQRETSFTQMMEIALEAAI